jgi:hypothetical protein
MALDHHWTPRRQGRGGVATGNGKGEREVAGAEHCHRADRHQHASQIRARHGRALGQRTIDPGVDPAALAHEGLEHAKLIDGAPALAGQTRRGQSGLCLRPLGQHIAERIDPLRTNREEV